MRPSESNPDYTLNGQQRFSPPGSAESLMNAASESVTKLRSAYGEIIKESMGFVKRYPVHTALGAAAVGFVAGFLIKRK